jgi:hypothetical protein
MFKKLELDASNNYGLLGKGKFDIVTGLHY